MKNFDITDLSYSLEADLKNKIDNKTKPLGALGELEKIALQVGLIQNTLSPVLTNPSLVVFAGDHGIAQEGVSAYPSEVTYQMVMNFLNGGAAINVFCKQHGLNLSVVDAGVNYDFPKTLAGLISAKVSNGTENFLVQQAMTVSEAEQSILYGSKIVKQLYDSDCNTIGIGEMGIGNTASASCLMSVLTNISIEQCVGKGTGLDDAGVLRKKEVLRKAIEFHSSDKTTLEWLATFGGFEIAQMTGAILQAAELKMLVMIDGFIASVAYLVAHEMEPSVKNYAVFCHQSQEQGHRKLLEYLAVNPLLSLNMRLGEGTGVAMAFPIIKSAVAFLNEMASFEAAGVSSKN
jgi:nicotinate-nucleotide--dimethylbenzimidazole phosphoribosyltransferase